MARAPKSIPKHVRYVKKASKIGMKVSMKALYTLLLLGLVYEDAIISPGAPVKVSRGKRFHREPFDFNSHCSISPNKHF